MKIGSNSSPKWPQKPVSNVKFIGIGLLLFLALVMSELRGFFDHMEDSAISARTKAEQNGAYLRDTILKLISSSEIGGAAIDGYVEVFNTKDKDQVRMIHSAAINAEYGMEYDELPINKEEETALIDGEPRIWETEDSFVSVHAFTATEECLECHHMPGDVLKPVPLGYVIGLVEVTHTKEALKETQAMLLGRTIQEIGLTLILVLVFGYGFYRLTIVLRQSEQRTTAIIKTVGEGIIVIDPDSRICFLNHEVCNIFGYSEEELFGQDVEMLMPEHYKTRHNEGRGRYLTTGQSNIMGRRIELEGIRKDGTIFPLELRLEETKAGSGIHFITAAIRDITERKQAQMTLEQFSRKLVESQENERKRIASELHDGFGQNLLVIKNGIRMCLQSLTNKDAIYKTLNQIASVTQQSIDEAREIAYDLHPYQLDKLGLKGALESVINRNSQVFGIKINSDIHNVDGCLPKNSEVHLYRIIQEGLNNIIKHSEASEATIYVRKNGDSMDIKISDNGKGFDIGSGGAHSTGNTGMGLAGISKRAKILDGRFDIESSPGKGTSLTIKILVPKNEE